MTEKSSLIIFGAILIMVILIISGLYVQDKSGSTNDLALIYNSKKESLLVEQQRLEAMISNLNQTLQSEIVKQQSLANQLSQINGGSIPSTNANPPSSGTTPSPSPAPTPAPAPAPVTRAS